jgi:hypothetical protein
VYINYRDVDWNNGGATIKAAIDGGYNVVIIAFWMMSGAADFAVTWSTLTPAQRATVMAYAHARNAVVLVAAGGSTELPYASTSGTMYGQRVAAFVTANGLDGVDFDMEEFGPGLVAGGLTAAQVLACTRTFLLILRVSLVIY